MRHLQADLERSDRVESYNLHAPRVVVRNGGGVHRRPKPAIGEREVRDGQAGVLVPHGRAERQLAEDQQGRREEDSRELIVDS